MKFRIACLVISFVAMVIAVVGCSKSGPPSIVAISGVKETVTEVTVGPDGLTSEQRNIVGRLKVDNKPGAVKHLYVFSAYSGQCILYSTVREKVTSSGKRLSPTSVATGNNTSGAVPGFQGVPFAHNGQTQYTGEMLQDDGTYGSSIEYLYWFDERGVYHSHYVSGGQIVHVSSEPMPVKNIIINIESK